MVLKPSRFYKIIQQMKKVILLNFIFLTFLFAISAQSEVFIIVHGTWSSFSPWHRCKSSFFKALEQNASKDTHVVGFNWNGKNSYQDRKLAAQELKNLILSYKNTKINIVAHSHGVNVAIKTSHLLANHPKAIQTLFALGVPVDEVNYIPNMNAIEFLYNLFSFNDFVQTTFGMFKRTFPDNPNIANLRVFINNNEPTHQQLHDKLIAQWIPHIHKDYVQQKKCSFRKFRYEQPAILCLFDNSEPIYTIDSYFEELLKEDQNLDLYLPSVFLRKKIIPNEEKQPKIE
jgi:hypothetical protein